MWVEAGSVILPDPPKMPEPYGSGGRRPRTKEELLAAANPVAASVAPKEAITELEQAEIKPGQEIEEVEEVIISPAMKKRELVSIAEGIGLDVKGKSKQEILDLLGSASE
jgi:hypothetical protein